MSDLFSSDVMDLRRRLTDAGWLPSIHAGVRCWRSPEGELLVEEEARKRLEAQEKAGSHQ